MFDNLRDLSDEPVDDDQLNSFNNDYAAPAATSAAASGKPSKSKKKGGKFMGMNSQQRFLIALMLMFTVCLLGLLVMFVTGAMSLF